MNIQFQLQEAFLEELRLTQTPFANQYGWYNSTVIVATISKLVLPHGPNTLSSEGASQHITDSAIDSAGNSSPLTAGSINIDNRLN